MFELHSSNKDTSPHSTFQTSGGILNLLEMRSSPKDLNPLWTFQNIGGTAQRLDAFFAAEAIQCLMLAVPLMG